MLLQFSVENYLSIKNRVFLNLEPSNDSSHEGNLSGKGTYKAVNSVLIYGANASGKSSLFKAITTAINMIRLSNSLQITSKLPVIPFKFDDECTAKPTSFEFSFIANDGLKYIYGFIANQNAILEEYLYCYKTAKPSLIFDRDIKRNPEYKFTRTSAAKMKAAAKMNTANKLFLPTATSWNVEETKPALEWFSGYIDTFAGTEQLGLWAMSSYHADADHSVQDFTKRLLKEADINICDMSVTSRILQHGFSEPVEQVILPSQGEPFEVRINTGHEITNSDGTVKRYELSLSEESQGTQRIILLGPIFKDTFDKGKILIIDEIDSSLHPFIVKYLLDLFRNPNINKKGAQLVVTTHESTLLSLDTFRRDQIYFTEKDANTGVTDLYSLDEFSVRKNENIQNGYLLGRYGAIPFLQTENIF